MSGFIDALSLFLTAADSVERLAHALHQQSDQTGHSELSTLGNMILEKPELVVSFLGAVQDAVKTHQETTPLDSKYDGGDG